MNFLNYLQAIIKKRYFIIGMLAFLTAMNFISCNAPRSNPFDPGNPNYSFVSLSGTVQTFSLPYTGIAGVSVFWSNSNIDVSTDADGKFIIDNIMPINGKLIFSKDGYLSDSLDVIWGNSKSLNYQVNLNRIPHLDSVSIYTVVINQFTPPGQTYQLVINSRISDKDNDIDSVYVENDQLGLMKALDFNVTSKDYETTLSNQDLNVTDIEQTIGLNFNIIVKDVFNRIYNVGNDKVSRVIKNGVLIQSPANDSIVTATPLLKWQRYKTGYPFSYTVEIFTNDFANSQLVLQQENVSSDSVSYQVTQPLSSRDYYWVIWVIDQFQNRVRSLPATFRVP